MPRGMVPSPQLAEAGLLFLTLLLLIFDIFLLGATSEKAYGQMETFSIWEALSFVSFCKDLFTFIIINSGLTAGVGAKYLKRILVTFACAFFILSLVLTVIFQQKDILLLAFAYWILTTSLIQVALLEKQFENNNDVQEEGVVTYDNNTGEILQMIRP